MKKPRSKFEGRVRDALGAAWAYETVSLPYTLANHYWPDFVQENRRVLIEAKGRFTGHDRRKMLAAKAANPDWEFRICFMRNNALYKGSKSTYMGWAAKHGFRATVFPVLPLDQQEVRSATKQKQKAGRCVRR